MTQRLTEYDKLTQGIIVREYMKAGGGKVTKSDEGRIREHLDTNPEALVRITDRLGITENGMPNPNFDPTKPKDVDTTIVDAIDKALLEGDGKVEDTALPDQEDKDKEVTEEDVEKQKEIDLNDEIVAELSGS